MNLGIMKSSVSLSAIIALVFLSACRDPEKYPGYEFMPDMYRGPGVEAYAPGLFNADSTSSRKPVAGTMPRGFTYFNYPNTKEGYIAAGNEVHNPLPNDSTNFEEGKRLYGIYCVNCHGENGMGDGNLPAADKFPPPPSYSTGNSSREGAMKDLSDGKIYHTITYGLNLMGPHSSQLLPEERWKVVMYVRHLQKFGAKTTAGGESTATAQADTTNKN